METKKETDTKMNLLEELEATLQYQGHFKNNDKHSYLLGYLYGIVINHPEGKKMIQDHIDIVRENELN